MELMDVRRVGLRCLMRIKRSCEKLRELITSIVVDDRWLIFLRGGKLDEWVLLKTS